MSIPQVPAGIFLPTIAIGACLGRAVGLITFVLSVSPVSITLNTKLLLSGNRCTAGIQLPGFSSLALLIHQ